MAKRNSNTDVLQYSVFIPQNIELESLLLLYPLSNVPNAKDYLLYILSIIKKQNDFTLLNSTKLQRIADNYSPLLKWLIERGILIRDNSYKPDEKPKGYKFTSEYLTESKEEFISTRTLIKKLNREKDKANRKKTVGSNNQPLKIEPENGNPGYGYEAYWMRTREIAKPLNLNSNKIREGLIHFGLVSDRIYDHTEKSNDKMFYYEFAGKKNGNKYPSLRINNILIEKIKALAIEHPDWFPPKKRKPPKKNRKSPNI